MLGNYHGKVVEETEDIGEMVAEIVAKMGDRDGRGDCMRGQAKNNGGGGREIDEDLPCTILFYCYMSACLRGSSAWCSSTRCSSLSCSST